MDSIPKQIVPFHSRPTSKLAENSRDSCHPAIYRIYTIYFGNIQVLNQELCVDFDNERFRLHFLFRLYE